MAFQIIAHTTTTIESKHRAVILLLDKSKAQTYFFLFFLAFVMLKNTSNDENLFWSIQWFFFSTISLFSALNLSSKKLIFNFFLPYLSPII